MNAIFNVKTWLVQIKGKQFLPLARGPLSIHKKINSALRFKDNKIFKRYDNLFDKEFIVSDIKFFYIIRIDEFNEDCIHVNLMEGIWDMTNFLWVEETLMEEEVEINDIQKSVDSWSDNSSYRMNFSLEKHLTQVQQVKKILKE